MIERIVRVCGWMAITCMLSGLVLHNAALMSAAIGFALAALFTLAVVILCLVMIGRGWL